MPGATNMAGGAKPSDCWASTRDGLIAICELIRSGDVLRYSEAAEVYLGRAICELGDGTDPMERQKSLSEEQV